MFDPLVPPVDLGSARARLRAEAVAAAGDEPVYHLTAPRQGSGDDPDWPRLPPTAAVVVADMILWRANRAELRSLSRSLAVGQALLFCEPTAEVGWRRASHRLGRSLWPRLVGHRFDVDVPAELRGAGLAVTEINRFGVGPFGIASYVLGRAEHIPRTGHPDG